MPERKPLKKSIRFEVFKRDSFTCQYCGAKAPDAILQVDHIIPVKEGGTDDIMNLVTSCRDCNLGKSCRMLSDDSVVVKRQRQAKEMQEKMEIIKMLAEWQRQLMEEQNKEIDMLEELLQLYHPESSFTGTGSRNIIRLIKRFGFRHVYECFEIALNQYDNCEEAIKKLGWICYNRRYRSDE